MVSSNVKRWVGIALCAGAAFLLFDTPAHAQSAEPAAVSVTAVADEPGVLIVAVEPDSPAHEAGIRRGAIVLAAGDVQVDDAQALAATIAALSPGDQLALTIQHGDEERTVEVTLAERNGAPFLGVRPYWSPDQMPVAARSFRVAPAPGMRVLPSAALWLADPEQMTDTVGIYVRSVVPDGPAAEAGLEAGALITAINGEPVAPETDLATLIAAHKPGDELALTIQRAADADGEETVTVTLGAKPGDPEAAYLGVQIAPMIGFRAERVVRPGVGAPGGLWQFRQHVPGDRLYFFRAVPAPPLPPVPPMWMTPYGYWPYGHWYGAPGYGAPYTAPPTDFIYLHPTPNAAPDVGVRSFARPFPGSESETFGWEGAPPDRMLPAQPAQPVEVEIETEVTL